MQALVALYHMPPSPDLLKDEAAIEEIVDGSVYRWLADNCAAEIFASPKAYTEW